MPDGADIVGEVAADFVGLHLADIGRAAAERGDADDAVGHRPARNDRRGAHDAVKPLRLRLVDQAHRALVQVVGDEEIILGTGEHVHDGVAEAEHVVAGRRHVEILIRWELSRVAFASRAARVKAWGLGMAQAWGLRIRGYGLGASVWSSRARRSAMSASVSPAMPRATLLASSVACGDSPAVSMTMRGCETLGEALELLGLVPDDVEILDDPLHKPPVGLAAPAMLQRREIGRGHPERVRHVLQENAALRRRSSRRRWPKGVTAHPRRGRPGAGGHRAPRRRRDGRRPPRSRRRWRADPAWRSQCGTVRRSTPRSSNSEPPSTAPPPLPVTTSTTL